MESPPPPLHDRAAGNLTVWYDGACPLCSREIAAMRRLDRDGKITFTDIADPAAPCPLPRDMALARFHVSENGRVLSGAAAFAAMWRALPALRWLGRLAQVPPFGLALEAAYRLFLRLRPVLQQLAGGPRT
ncbi:MAG: thiol-disulfide oxidoreductase DCC family protein [Novosphingobium meiothermophilum]